MAGNARIHSVLDFAPETLLSFNATIRPSDYLPPICSLLALLTIPCSRTLQGDGRFSLVPVLPLCVMTDLRPRGASAYLAIPR